jgi:hypothetical protein
MQVCVCGGWIYFTVMAARGEGGALDAKSAATQASQSSIGRVIVISTFGRFGEVIVKFVEPWLPDMAHRTSSTSQDFASIFPGILSGFGDHEIKLSSLHVAFDPSVEGLFLELDKPFSKLRKFARLQTFDA